MTKLINDLNSLPFSLKNDRDLPLNQRLQHAYHWEQAFCNAQPQQERHLEKPPVDIAAATLAKKIEPPLKIDSAHTVNATAFVMQAERGGFNALSAKAADQAHLNYGVADKTLPGTFLNKDATNQPSNPKTVKPALNLVNTPMILGQLKHQWAVTYCYEQDRVVELAIRVRHQSVSPEKMTAELKLTLQTMGLSLGKLTINGVLVWEAQRQTTPVFDI